MTSISAPKCSGVLALLACTAALVSCQFAFGDFHVEHTAQGGSSAWDQSSGGALLGSTDAASGGQSAVAIGSMGGSSVSSDSGDASSAGGSGGIVGTASGGSTANESFDAEVGDSQPNGGSTAASGANDTGGVG